LRNLAYDIKRKHGLRVFANSMLRIILKRNEVMEGWRKLHNEELHKLLFSPSIISGAHIGFWKESQTEGDH
jgi:hypothetical protein